MKKIALATVVFLVLVISPFCGVLVQAETLDWKLVDLDYSHTLTDGSLAVDSSGNPHIIYDGKYFVWTGSKWNVQDVGFSGKLVLDKNDNPHVVYSVGKYYNQTSGLYLYDIFYASLSGSTWTTETVTTQLWPDPSPNLALDQDGNPHVAYMQGYEYVMYASRNGSAWNTKIVDTQSSTCQPQIAVDANSNPHIVYSSKAFDEMSVASWNGTGWDIQKTKGFADSASIALDSTGTPHVFYISYQSSSNSRSYWNYADWNGLTWDTQSVAENITYFDSKTSLAFDSHGKPHVSFFSINGLSTSVADSGLLGYATYNGATWDIQRVNVDPSGEGLSVNLALDSADKPHILCCNQEYHYQNGTYNQVSTFYARYASLSDLPSITSLPSMPPRETAPNIGTLDPSTIQYIAGIGRTFALVTIIALGVLAVILIAVLVVTQRKLKTKKAEQT
jgi:hypothetical protein